MKVTVDGTVGEYKHLDSTPPEGSKPFSVGTMEAVVDYEPQKLRQLRPLAQVALAIPGSLPSEGQYVLQKLAIVFSKRGNVSEGVLKDLIFAFEAHGVPPLLTITGIEQLRQHGYVFYESPDGHRMHFEVDSLPEAWIRYERKLLDLVYTS